jgi:CheY-like chemotaxis protein
MPDEDGYSFINRVRSLSQDEGGNTPAAALTAYARDEDRKQALAAGYQMHIAKPIGAGQLVNMIAKLAGLEN